jgi:hypothetical protein
VCLAQARSRMDCGKESDGDGCHLGPIDPSEIHRCGANEVHVRPLSSSSSPSLLSFLRVWQVTV